ncbi:MAG TPA: hypothetical protein VMC80_02620 [Patescibacteria group bacterium]|nr:hypothetical protein [Patescibacteria group bacterium]
MAVKRVKYSRTFLSRTGEVDSGGYHKSEFVSAQVLSEEDGDIRDQIQERFEFYNEEDERFSKHRRFGFDGKMQYFYRISGHPTDEKDSLKNIPYKTEVDITKAGALEELDKQSDLERFLAENGFVKIN